MKYKNASSAQVWIHAPVHRVWEALTTPAQIKDYFFGTNAVSDWKEGSMLYFRGEWEGKQYEDKGKILELKEDSVFKYTYHSSFSTLPDEPENYQVITYELAEKNNGTQLKITQENVESKESAEHSEENWNGVLQALKAYVEKKNHEGALPTS